MNIDQDILLKKEVDENSDIPVITQILRIATYDEYKALETYETVIKVHGNVTPFSNIVEAEKNHVSAMLSFCAKYNVEPPVNDWVGNIEVPQTLVECCQMGVEAEIENIAMYDHLLDYAPNEEIQDLFYRLQAASHNNHLPAFESCVARTQEESTTAFSPKHHDVYRLVEKTVGEDLKKLLPEDFQNLLGAGNRDLLIGAAIGAGAIYLLDEMKNKKED